MHDLEKFYWNLIRTIPYAKRFVILLEIKDVLVINFDCLFERDYSLRGVDQLIYQIHKLGNGKRFLFYTEDGTVLQLSGAIGIIENIVKCFNLTENTCGVVCRTDLNIPNVTIINKSPIRYWCDILYPTIKDIPIPQGPFSKKFAAWYHRGTFYRLMMAKYLKENYSDDSFISYQEQGMLIDRAFKEYFIEENTWANTNTPIIYDQLFPNRVYDHNMIAGSGRKPYNNYFLEVVIESDCVTTEWITEKTIKNLYIGKPFILMGGAGVLAKIRDLGFQTFSPWIDETYDTIENNYLRFEAIKREIDRIANKSLDELTQMQQELRSIFEHNRENYGKYINGGR